VLQALAQLSLAVALAALPNDAGPIGDPGFETEGALGAFSTWQSCGDVPAALERENAHGGRWAVSLGRSSGGEIKGDSAICQQVRIPMAHSVLLDYWALVDSTEPDATRAYQEVAFYDGDGAPDRTKPFDVVVRDVANSAGRFRHYTFDITELAGQTLYLSFGVHGDGNPSYATSFVVDDVSFVVEMPVR
jgi:hypothetical protein